MNSILVYQLDYFTKLDAHKIIKRKLLLTELD